MRPSAKPTIADLYLAFRQAKTALYFERRGVGLLDLAQFEQNLPANLGALTGLLGRQSWFDEVPVGKTWVVPKRLHGNEIMDVVRIGVPRGRDSGRPLDVQVPPLHDCDGQLACGR